MEVFVANRHNSLKDLIAIIRRLGKKAGFCYDIFISLFASMVLDALSQIVVVDGSDGKRHVHHAFQVVQMS